MYTKYTGLVSLWLPLGIPYGLEPSLCSYLIVGSLQALRDRFNTTGTKWAKRVTEQSSAKHFIESATSQSVEETWNRMKMHTHWLEWTESCDSRYKGKPRRKYKHLRELSRQDLKTLINMRSTSGWPYQEHDGKRPKCPCLRDIITHDHLANRCGTIAPSTAPINRNSRPRDLLA